MRRTPRLALSLIALATAVAALTSPAAADAAPTWKCRASAAYLASPGQERVEPFHAGGGATCADDEAHLAGDRTVGPLSQSNPFARTTVEPDGEQPAAQRIRAEARVDATTIASADGNFVLRAEAIQAQANARCVGTRPVLSGSSEVARATVNGQAVLLDSGLDQIGTGLNGSPLGGLIQVRFNEQEASGNSLVRRAVHVRITDATGAVVLDAVSGEASVGLDAGLCLAAGDGGAPVCPAGAEYDAASGLCVRIVTVRQSGNRGNGNDGGDGSTRGRGPCPAGFAPTSDGNCIRAIPVDDDGNPQGGSVVPLDEVPGARKSPCRNRRFGKKLVAIRGTNRRDNLTGTNKSDRMFVLGGNDLVSGGRGNDCLEGGRGKNRLEGSTGSDSLYGHRRKDTLIGGPGADRLYGRRGNDRIDGGRGRNRVSAGRGNDRIQLTTTASRSRVDCGPGRDTLRINRLKRNRVRRCERVFVLKRRR
jgi:Ca2+-binding RTX toxin-like protein